MRGNFTTGLKRRLKNYRLGMLVSEVKNFALYIPRQINNLERRFISLKPKKPPRGNVLLCYENKAFFLKHGETVPGDHTNRWESLQIAETFLDLGYQVDVIGENNDRFLPAKNYSLFVGNRINFDRIADHLNRDCVKILHIDTAHWLFNNTSEHRRLLTLQQRRGFTLTTRRSLAPNLAIEHADHATILGNEFTISTYKYANKPFYRVPISVPAMYPWPENKDFDQTRKHFLWLGGYGFVHKGLDLVLEAFADMPDYHLTICGRIDDEKDFQRAFYELLYETPNIHTEGWIDIESRKFLEISHRCIALIYPSCSEGQCGGVVSCMHAGLIPIISYQSGVDVHESFGLILKECSVDEIKSSIRKVSSFSGRELKSMARNAWDFARANHTRERFVEEYRKAMSSIMALSRNKESVVEKKTSGRLYQAASSVSDTR